MDRDQAGALRWVIAILLTAAIIGLVVLARGEPDRGGPTVADVARALEAL